MTINLILKDNQQPSETLRSLACSIYLSYGSEGEFVFYNFKAQELFTGLTLYLFENEIDCNLEELTKIIDLESIDYLENWLNFILDSDIKLSKDCVRYLNTYDNNLTRQSRQYTIEALKKPLIELSSITDNDFAQWLNGQRYKLLMNKELNSLASA